MSAVVQDYSGQTLLSLGREKLVPGKDLSFKVPQDKIIKEFIIVAKGSAKSVHAGAAPKVRQYGVLDGMLSEMYLSRKGTDRVRSYRGVRQLRHTIERNFGDGDPAVYKQNSTELGDGESQGLLTFGATGEDVAFKESVSILMENKNSGSYFTTLFSTKQLQTATLNIKPGAYASIQSPDDAAVATITADIEIEVFASCADHALDLSDKFIDWVQTYGELEFSGRQDNARHYLRPQGEVQGILITGQKGSKRQPFNFENLSKTRIELRFAGILLFEGTLLQLQAVNANKNSMLAHRKGSVYINFLNNSAFGTGLNVGEGTGVRDIEILVTTDASLSYSPDPVRLVFEYDQIIRTSAGK